MLFVAVEGWKQETKLENMSEVAKDVHLRLVSWVVESRCHLSRVKLIKIKILMYVVSGPQITQ